MGLVRSAAIVAAMSAMALAGCQKKGSDSAGSVPEQADNGGKAAEKLDCPSKFNFPASAQTVPHDIAGLYAGVPLRDATLFIKCQDKSKTYQVQDEGQSFGMNTYGDNPHQHLKVSYTPPGPDQTGGEDFDMISMGMSGQEVVQAIFHSQTFAKGKQPTALDLSKSLVAKYGQPSQMNENNYAVDMVWIYDTTGRPISKSDPLFNQCVNGVQATGSMSLSEACGFSVAARVGKASDNELLTQKLDVGMADQADLFNKLKQLQSAYDVAATAKKQSDAAKAAGNANGAKL